jgi:DNA-binding transcriptional ArsR family regulator
MKNVLDKIFGSRVRAKILGWFFTHIDEKFFVRQLAPILGEDPTNISREMARLESLGILISTRQGNQKQFQVNKECSFLEELRGLVLKTIGIAGQLKLEPGES